jgi:hypothetical protein
VRKVYFCRFISNLLLLVSLEDTLSFDDEDSEESEQTVQVQAQTTEKQPFCEMQEQQLRQSDPQFNVFPRDVFLSSFKSCVEDSTSGEWGKALMTAWNNADSAITQNIMKEPEQTQNPSDAPGAYWD